jgi:hypothetical protein
MVDMLFSASSDGSRLRPEGFERLDARGHSHNRLRQTAFIGSAESGAPGLCVSDSALKKLIAVWPNLPEAIKAGILALVQATVGSDA